ncbi:hypothetical protein GWI33_008921 [Rhynchophorus ferrugineus]|uniref:Uncharacterized protein n=1 Tax=Rhynchophorus ferrugineus TaxID=354439 RepID=A0A834ISY5_RHYFE|nr:hypothetical protein GWI33_008921 [Rhynchophorus ferrugineus]
MAYERPKFHYYDLNPNNEITPLVFKVGFGLGVVHGLIRSDDILRSILFVANDASPSVNNFVFVGHNGCHIVRTAIKNSEPPVNGAVVHIKQNFFRSRLFAQQARRLLHKK